VKSRLVSLARALWTHKGKVLIIAGCVVVFLLMLLGYTGRWSWTGLAGTTQVTITKGNTQTVQAMPITLWQWIQVLIVPVVLAIAGYWLNQLQTRRTQFQATETQEETELTAYMSYLSDLMLKEGLLESKEGDAVRVIATARTLAVFRRLNGARKAVVLKFLHDAGLIKKDNPIVSLSGADLSGAHLNGAHLKGADLSNTILTNALLNIANLREANLMYADLSGARLFNVMLNNANLMSAGLRDAYLDHADLGRVNLTVADLSGAIMSAASLRGANLMGAHLNNVDLTSADLSDTIVNGSILDGSIMTGATITQEQLNGFHSLQGTTLPDGTKHI
jgi:uncharacterized protein YjbI with pentapeptide repeats